MPRLTLCQRCGNTFNPATGCECRKQDDQQRLSTTERGYDGWWKRYSEDYRKRNPYCVCCSARGITTPSNVVDHIVPFHREGKIDERLRTDPQNHQALCDGRNNQPDCHGTIKKAFEHRWRDASPAVIRIRWQQLMNRLRLGGIL